MHKNNARSAIGQLNTVALSAVRHVYGSGRFWCIAVVAMLLIWQTRSYAGQITINRSGASIDGFLDSHDNFTFAGSQFEHGVVLGEGTGAAEAFYRILLPPRQVGNSSITSLLLIVHGQRWGSPVLRVGRDSFYSYDLPAGTDDRYFIYDSTLPQMLSDVEAGLSSGLDVVVEAEWGTDKFDLSHIEVICSYSNVSSDALAKYQLYYGSYRALSFYNSRVIQPLWVDQGSYSIRQYFLPACQEVLAIADNLSGLEGSAYDAMKATIEVLESFETLGTILVGAWDFTAFWPIYSSYGGPSPVSVSTRVTIASNSMKSLTLVWRDSFFDGILVETERVSINAAIEAARADLVTLRTALRNAVDSTWKVYAWSSLGQETAEIILHSLTPMLNVSYTQNSQSTEPSYLTTIIDSLNAISDGAPPTPDPMTWSVTPRPSGDYTLTMTASPASDPSGVEYFFDEVSGNPGGTDSGWQSSPAYTDTALVSGLQYCYRVRARDRSSSANSTGFSQTVCATPSGTSPKYVYAGTVTCKSIGSEDDLWPALDPTTSFYYGEDPDHLCLRVELRNVYMNLDYSPLIKVYCKFYTPSGAEYGSFYWELEDPRGSGFAWWDPNICYVSVGWLHQSGFEFDTIPGRWTYTVSIDDGEGGGEMLVDTKYFDILERSPLPATDP